VHVVDVHVHLDDRQAGHRLDRPLHAALDLGGDFRNPVTVFDDDRDIDRGFLLADFDLDALGQILPAEQLGDAAGDAAAHARHAAHFHRRQSRDHRDDLRRDLDRADLRAFEFGRFRYGFHAAPPCQLLRSRAPGPPAPARRKRGIWAYPCLFLYYSIVREL